MPPLAKRDQDRLYDLIRQARSRKDERAFVAEGPHLVERALEEAQKGIKLIAVTVDATHEQARLIALAHKQKTSVYTITQRTAERISDTQKTQGIFAEIDMPDDQVTPNYRGITLALDRIQDPGNLGTIIRTAAWFGVERMLLSAGSADCYNPKVLRSTQGEIFSVRIRDNIDLNAEVIKGKDHGVRIIVATSHQPAGSVYEMQVFENAMLIFGSEAHGVELSVEQNADERVTIPRFGAGESLNVATSVGIILAEYTFRRRKNMMNSYS